MKTTLNLLLAASPAMAELAAHLPLSLPSLTAGVYFFPVSTSAKVAPGRVAYGAPIRVADPVGVWAVETPAAAAAGPAACRPADVRDAADAGVARRCDGAGPGGLLVSMKDSGVAFACYCGASEDAAAAGPGEVQAQDQRGWDKRGDDDAQRGWNKRRSNSEDGDSTDEMTAQDQRGWNKRGGDDSTEQVATTGVQRGWNKRRGDDDAQRGWNKRSSSSEDDDSTDEMTTQDQRGWNKRGDDDAQRGWNKRHADDQRGWNRLSAGDRPSSSPAEPRQQPETRADAGAEMQTQDQRGWNKRSGGTDKPVQATGVQRGWHRRATAQRGML